MLRCRCECPGSGEQLPGIAAILAGTSAASGAAVGQPGSSRCQTGRSEVLPVAVSLIARLGIHLTKK